MSPWEIDWKNRSCRVPFVIPIMISTTTHQMAFKQLKIRMQLHRMPALSSMQMGLLHWIQQTTMMIIMTATTTKNQFQLKIAWLIRHQILSAWIRTNGRQTSWMTLIGHIVWTMESSINRSTNNSSNSPIRSSILTQNQHLKAFGQWRRNAKRIVSVVLLVFLFR